MLKKVQYITIVVGFICAIGATAINLYLGRDWSWSAISAMWIMSCYFQQQNIDRYEKLLGIKD